MSEELNCSEGARMLIERMQSHPDDFKYNGRFSRIADQIRGNTPVGYADMSDRDRSALTAAYEKHIMEPALTEYVVDEIFNGDKRREEEKQNAVSSSVITNGWSDPRVVSPGGVFNPAQGRQLFKYDEELEKRRESIFENIQRKLQRKPK